MDVPIGHSLFGKAIPCGCQTERRVDRLAKVSRLSGEMLTWQFENTLRHAGNAEAFDAALALAEKPAWMLTLHGANGRGKTRLMVCLVNEARRRGTPGLYITTEELLDYLRETFSPQSDQPYGQFWSRLTSVPILILDEFDRFNPTPWAEAKFFQLIEARYRQGEELLTGLATNMRVDSLPDALRSRIRDRRCRVCAVQGVDVRERL